MKLHYRLNKRSIEEKESEDLYLQNIHSVDQNIGEVIEYKNKVSILGENMNK